MEMASMSKTTTLCLLLLLFRATLSHSENTVATNGAAIARQLTELARIKWGLLTASPSARKSTTIHSSKNRPNSVSHVKSPFSVVDISAEKKGFANRSPLKSFNTTITNIDAVDPISSSPPPGTTLFPTSSVSVSGIFSLTQKAILQSAGPISRSILFGAQLALAFHLSKALWAVIKEVLEELNEELSFSKWGKDDVREEHDLPYTDEDSLDEVSSELDPCDTAPRWNKNQNGKAISPNRAAARDLAARLRSAGLPSASDVPMNDSERNDINAWTVENVMKSLTRTEGSILSQTLLAPLDGGLVNGVQDDSADSLENVAAEAWNAIGGLADAKESLLDLAFPLLPQQPTSEPDGCYYGGLLRNPPGLLLYGPPGCGKGMLVRALAATVGARFLVVSPSCLLRKYVGETNLNVRALFSVARKIAPCIIFVDELDGLFRERGGEDHDVSRDLKTEFLQLWDGIKNHVHGGARGTPPSILVIGATNRPFDVDPAFLRRMPRRVFVGLPNYDARVAVLQSMLRNVPLDSSFDISHIAHKTENYSPSDIREVLQTAALYPLREARALAMSMSQSQNNNAGDDKTIHGTSDMLTLRPLMTNDVLKALERVKPTHFSKQYQRDLMEYAQNAGESNHEYQINYNNSPSLSGEFDSSGPNGNGNYNHNFFQDVGNFDTTSLSDDYKDETDSYNDSDGSSSSDLDDF